MELTLDNCLDVLWDYLLDVYEDVIPKYRDEYPHSLDFGLEEYEFKQLAMWFLCCKKDKHGDTVVDKFVERYVDDPKIASRLLRIRGWRHDTFVVHDMPDHNMIMNVTAQSTGKKIRIQATPETAHVYTEGMTFWGPVYPWLDDGTFRTAGIMSMKKPSTAYSFTKSNMRPFYRLSLQLAHVPEKNAAESITLTPKTKMRTILKQLPAEWVNGICDALKIKQRCTKNEKIFLIASVLTSRARLRRVIHGLSRDELGALEMVLENGGSIKYHIFCKKTGEDDTVWSWKEDPKSVIGRLRRRGLLVVGKRRIGTKSYRIVMIPYDVAGPLAQCLRF